MVIAEVSEKHLVQRVLMIELNLFPFPKSFYYIKYVNMHICISVLTLHTGNMELSSATWLFSLSKYTPAILPDHDVHLALLYSL